MVLVATVAAGVLINTSISLQQEAQNTLNDSLSQISTGIEFVEVTGFVNENADVEYLKILVRPHIGSQSIHLENALVIERSSTDDRWSGVSRKKYIDPENYQLNSDSSILHQHFTVRKVEGEENNPTKLEDQKDLALIIVNLKADPDDSDDTKITIVPERGFQTYYSLSIPTGLQKEEYYYPNLKPILV